MFKVYEKDKCKNLRLNPSGTGVDTIVPGTILINTSNGAEKAGAGDTMTLANAGLFYVSADYYSNTNNASYGNTTDPVNAQAYGSSCSIAAIPLIDNFDAIIVTTLDLNLYDLLTITNGAWAVAGTAGEVAIAMVTKDNDNALGASVDTNITTMIIPHEVA